MTKFKVCFILSFFLFTKAIAQNNAETIDRFVQKLIFVINKNHFMKIFHEFFLTTIILFPVCANIICS